MTGEGQELHHHLRLRRTEVLTVRGAGTPAVLKGQVQLGHLFAPTKRELQFAGDPVLLPKSRIQSQVDGELQLDRKSTRLNSSHRCISYAVFCLKKKKNKK